jgi:hypothetical protein
VVVLECIKIHMKAYIDKIIFKGLRALLILYFLNQRILM